MCFANHKYRHLPPIPKGRSATPNGGQSSEMPCPHFLTYPPPVNERIRRLGYYSHPGVTRVSEDTYMFFEPIESQENATVKPLSLHAGAIRLICITDGILRKGIIPSALPAGYLEVAYIINTYAYRGDDVRLAELGMNNVVIKAGSPILFTMFHLAPSTYGASDEDPNSLENDPNVKHAMQIFMRDAIMRQAGLADPTFAAQRRPINPGPSTMFGPGPTYFAGPQRGRAPFQPYKYRGGRGGGAERRINDRPRHKPTHSSPRRTRSPSPDAYHSDRDRRPRTPLANRLGSPAPEPYPHNSDDEMSPA